MDEVGRSGLGEGADRVLAVLASADPGGLTPGELVAASKLSERSCRRAVGRLRTAGMVTRASAHGKVRLAGVMPAGDVAPVATVPVESAAPVRTARVVEVDGAALDRLAAAVELLPTAPHRAAFRLAVAAVVARHHCRRNVPSGWPGIILCGPSKSFKSIVGIAVLRVFGLDEARHLRMLPGETERSLWGRRAQQPGGGWAFAPSWVLEQPALVVDECDKGNRDQVRSILRLLQGEALVGGEGGELVELAPTAIACANDLRVFPPEYRRRSVVVDTTPLVGELPADSAKVARAFLGALPRLDLAGIRPTWSGEPPVEVADQLASLLHDSLAQEMWQGTDERSLSNIVGAYAAVWCDRDGHRAVGEMAGDYVDCSGTLNGAAAAPTVELPDAEARERDRRERATRAEAAERRELERRLELAEQRAELLDVIGGHRPDPDWWAGSPWRREALRIAARLDALVEEVVGADDEPTLRRLAARVTDTAAAIGALPRPAVLDEPPTLRALPAGEWDTDDEDQDDEDQDGDDDVDREALGLAYGAAFKTARAWRAGGRSPWLGRRPRAKALAVTSRAVEPAERTWQLECGHGGRPADAGAAMARGGFACSQCGGMVRRIVG